MPRKTQVIDAEVVATDSQIGTSANWQLLPISPGGEADFARAIIADHAHFNRTSREAAFAALRIGLRLCWLKDNAPHGSLEPFIKEHLSAISRRALTNYKTAAEKFVKDAGLLDKKSHKLTNGKAIAPILEVQLDLFGDPDAKFTGALNKLAKWVGDRGLSDLYREAKGGYDRKDETGKIIAGKGKFVSEEQLKALAKEEATDIHNRLNAFFAALHHTRLPRDLRDILDAALEGSRQHLKAVKD